MNYVVGYMMSPDKSKVALVWKERPKWQRGKLNGIGGKIEKYEWVDSSMQEQSAKCAMVREFVEETGVLTEPLTWELFAITYGPCSNDEDNFKVYYFRAFSDRVHDVKSITDEIVDVFRVEEVSDLPQVTHNSWMMRMALDCPEGTVYHIREETNE